MTRAMFVTAVGRISGVDTSAYTSGGFSDVNIDSWYGPYVAWASSNNLVNGVGGGLFDPDRAITQQELAFCFSDTLLSWGSICLQTQKSLSQMRRMRLPGRQTR